MPSAILKAWADDAGTIRSVAIDAVVRNKKFGPCGNRFLVALVRIHDRDGLDAKRKPDGKIFLVLNELQTVTGHKVVAGVAALRS